MAESYRPGDRELLIRDANGLALAYVYFEEPTMKQVDQGRCAAHWRQAARAAALDLAG